MTKVTNFIKAMTSIPPVFTDGFLLVTSSFFAGLLTYLSTSEAYEYVPVALLFYLKVFLGATSASISALVAFRSKVYTQHQQQVKADATGQTQTVSTTPSTQKE